MREFLTSIRESRIRDSWKFVSYVEIRFY